MRLKIGTRVATAARLDGVFIVCGLGERFAVLKAEGGGVSRVPRANLRRCLTARSRARLEEKARLQGVAADEMQRFYQAVFGGSESQIRRRLFGRKRRYKPTGRPRGKPRKADTPERIKDRERRSRYLLRAGV